MDSPKNAEKINKCAIELLSSLVTPLVDKSELSTEEVKGFDDTLRYKLSMITDCEDFEYLNKASNPERKWKLNDLNTQARWNFVRMCLHLLEIVHNTICESQDEKMKLLSVAQKRVLEKAFQFILSLGLLPYLLPGVGVSLKKKCRHFEHVKPEALTDFAKYRRLCFTLDAILKLNSTDVFHEIIISRHLEDVLAALFQLSFVPFKRPVQHELNDAISQMSLESLDDNYEVDKMSYSLWIKLENNRKRFRSELEKLQSQLYRPLVIRNYMVLLGSNKAPRWLRQNLTRLLTGLVLEENGVIAAIKGIIDVNNESPTLSSHCTTVAKLISTIFCNENESKMKLLSSQLEKILSKDTVQPHDYVFINVIASAVKEMLQIDQKRTEEYLLGAILNPLRNIDVCSGEEISKAIIQIYNLCVVPSNETVAVPISVITSVSSILFFVYTHIKDGVCYLKSPVKELLQRLLLEKDEDKLSRLLDVSILDEQVVPEIVRIPVGRKIMLSSEGGISITKREVDLCELERGLIMYHLMKELEVRENIISSFFIYLLKKFIHYSANENGGTKRMIVVFLLTQLSQDSDALKHILKNSEKIILFVGELLDMQNEEDDQNADIIRVCLTFLTMVLYDVRKKKDVNWRTFSSLIPPLEKLKKSYLPDIMLLAEEVHNLIVTRGVASTDGVNDKSNPLIEEIPQTACEKATEEACDPLLPVRAHALMELIDLLKKGDVETLAKKEKIFLLFEENLKNEDSFLYLRAIEGLACLAVMKPNSVLPLLCQGFQGLNLCSTVETRLKVGEILVRTVKLLNDFILPHKSLLINTFINGAKDEDSTIRTSSLSNLGEVCLTIQWNIEDVVYEVIECARQALYDHSVEPRRAAVFLIAALFRGLKTSVLEVTRLSDLYRTLKHIRSNDNDQVMRTQAELSLEVLNEIMKDFFIAKPVMEKKFCI